MGHCMSIFINGYNMTSHPLGFCLYNLAMNPEVQDKLRKEIKTFGFSSVDALSYYLIESMEYLDMFMCGKIICLYLLHEFKLYLNKIKIK